MLVLLLGAGAAHAVDARPAYARGVWQLGLSGGYADGFAAFGSGGSPNEEVRMRVLLARAGTTVTDPLGADRWFEGSLSAHLETQLLWLREPRRGFGGGATFRLRYHLRHFASRGVVPYLDGGAGMGSIDFGLPSQRDGFNFLLGGGVGVSLHATEWMAVTLGWRFHHISNAGSRSPNVGINAHLYSAGLTFFLPGPDGWGGERRASIAGARRAGAP